MELDSCHKSGKRKKETREIGRARTAVRVLRCDRGELDWQSTHLTLLVTHSSYQETDLNHLNLLLQSMYREISKFEILFSKKNNLSCSYIFSLIKTHIFCFWHCNLLISCLIQPWFTFSLGTSILHFHWALQFFHYKLLDVSLDGETFSQISFLDTCI